MKEPGESSGMESEGNRGCEVEGLDGADGGRRLRAKAEGEGLGECEAEGDVARRLLKAG